MKKLWLLAIALLCTIAAPALLHAQNTAPATGITGKWHFVLDTSGGPRDFDADFTIDPDGNVGGTFGKSTVVGTFKEGHLLLDFSTTSEEAGETAQLKIDGKFEDPATLAGNWQFSSYDGTFRAIRPKPETPSN